MSNIQLILGGATKVVRVGDKAEYALTNRANEWKYFKQQATEQDVAAFCESMFGTSDIDGYLAMGADKTILQLSRLMFLHEPLAWAIRELFFKIAKYYESVLCDIVGGYANWEERWILDDPDDTSSKPLWNLSRDTTFQKSIGKNPALKKWVKIVTKSWLYPGFCPKVPGKRLATLLQFPIWSLLEAAGRSVDIEKLREFSKRAAVILAESRDFTPPTILVKMKQTGNDIMSKIDSIVAGEYLLLPALETLEQHYIAKAQLFNELTTEWPL